jgi:hypothetical protein
MSGNGLSDEKRAEWARIAANELDYQAGLARQTPPPEERHALAQKLFWRALALSTSNEPEMLREGYADTSNALNLLEGIKGHGGVAPTNELKVCIGQKLTYSER